MPWFYAEFGQQVGPVDEEAFQVLVAEGRIRPQTLVWQQGMADWQPLSSLNGTAPEIPQPNGAAVCAECHALFDPGTMALFGATHVCAACKRVYTQRILEGVPAPTVMHYAGFGLRVLALLIDALMLWLLALIYSGPIFAAFSVDTHDAARVVAFEGLIGTITLLVSLFYEVLFVWRFGATPGKMICRIRIVRSDGRKISFVRSCARYLGKVLDVFAFMIGYLMAAFDGQRRALHDRLADTRVLNIAPDETRVAGGCPVCEGSLPPDTWNLGYETLCPHCRSPLAVLAFPALVTSRVVTTPQPAVESGESTCFFHAGNAAVVPCDHCGRFLCTLCRVEFGSQNWCTSCVERERQQAKLPAMVNRRALYDNLALMLLTIPLLVIPFFWVALITAPTALFIVIRYWRAQRTLIPRSKVRLAIVGVLAIVEFVAVLRVLTFLAQNRATF